MSDDDLDRSFVVTKNTNIINISININSQQVNEVSFEIPIKRYSGNLLATEITNEFENDVNTNNLSVRFIDQNNINGPTFYIESEDQASSPKTYIFNYEKTTARSLLGMENSISYQFTTGSDYMYFGVGKANENVENVADLLIQSEILRRQQTFAVTEEVISNILNSLSQPYLNNFNFGFRASVLSEGLRFSSGARYGFISINDYKTNSKSEIQVVYNDSVFDDHIIARMNLIPITANTLSVRDSGMSKLLNKTRRYKVPVDIQKFTIKLYDEYGRIIDMNNMDWSFTLEFEKEGKKLTINENS